MLVVTLMFVVMLVVAGKRPGAEHSCRRSLSSADTEPRWSQLYQKLGRSLNSLMALINEFIREQGNSVCRTAICQLSTRPLGTD